jgi:hypothetical protein
MGCFRLLTTVPGIADLSRPPTPRPPQTLRGGELPLLLRIQSTPDSSHDSIPTTVSTTPDSSSRPVSQTFRFIVQPSTSSPDPVPVQDEQDSPTAARSTSSPLPTSSSDYFSLMEDVWRYHNSSSFPPSSPGSEVYRGSLVASLDHQDPLEGVSTPSEYPSTPSTGGFHKTAGEDLQVLKHVTPKMLGEVADQISSTLIDCKPFPSRLSLGSRAILEQAIKPDPTSELHLHSALAGRTRARRLSAPPHLLSRKPSGEIQRPSVVLLRHKKSLPSPPLSPTTASDAPVRSTDDTEARIVSVHQKRVSRRQRAIQELVDTELSYASELVYLLCSSKPRIRADDFREACRFVATFSLHEQGESN